MTLLHILRARPEEVIYKLRPKYKQKYSARTFKKKDLAINAAFYEAKVVGGCEVWEITRYDMDSYCEPSHEMIAKFTIRDCKNG